MPSPRLTILAALAAAAVLALPATAPAAGWLPSKAVSRAGSSAPQVAMGPGGNATIIFMRGGVLRAVGRKPGGAFRSLGALSGSGASAPYIAAGRTGAIGVTWIEGGGGSWTIRAARRTGSHAFVDRRTVATSSARPHAPKIDLDGTGDPTVAWTVDQPGANEPRLIRIATGTVGGAYGPADSSSADTFLGNLGLKVDRAGNATVAWQSRPCTIPTCPQWQVHAASRPAGGPMWSAEQLTETSANDTADPRPALGVNDAGDVT